MVTLRPLASSTAPSEAAAIPLPKEETTPPVTKIKRVIVALQRSQKIGKKLSLKGVLVNILV
jgi:hypothetical protein